MNISPMLDNVSQAEELLIRLIYGAEVWKCSYEDRSYFTLVKVPTLGCPLITIPQSELQFSFARTGGPGGQNVNKVETKVTVVFDYLASRVLTAEEKERIARSKIILGRIDAKGCIAIVSQEHRTQSLNKKAALEKLHELLTLAMRTQRKRVPTKRTRASERKRLDTKRVRSGIKAGRRRVGDVSDG